MKTNKTLLLQMATLVLFAAACKKDTVSNTPSMPAVQLAVVTTIDISAITKTTAVCGGKISSDGGAPVAALGICWSTKAEPTIADSKTIDDKAKVTYISALTGLTNGAVYNVRAYATNSSGTAYGNTVTFAALEIGQDYLGGKIAYVLAPGDPGYSAGTAHGLIISPSTGASLKWFNGTYSITTATATALGTGNANTNLIVSKSGPGNYSAAACASEKSNNYTDWYLPSKDELNKCWLAKDKLPGYFTAGYYWSSTESGSSTAWIQSFTTGVQSTYDKNGSGFGTQAIRSF